jgi:transposase
MCSGCSSPKRGQESQALGHSKGGFSTSIKALVDALGNPIQFVLTAGQTNDITVADTLLEDWKEKIRYLLADKGFDADWFVELLSKHSIIAVIPSKSNRKIQREYDKDLYKERNVVERFFNKIKHYRRVFSRFDKLDTAYLAFLSLASVMIWFRRKIITLK